MNQPKVHLRRNVTHTMCGRTIERVSGASDDEYNTTPPVTGLRTNTTCASCRLLDARRTAKVQAS